jgi:hypothetical protein
MSGASQLGVKYKYLQRKLVISGFSKQKILQISFVCHVLTLPIMTILGAFTSKYNYSVPN